MPIRDGSQMGRPGFDHPLIGSLQHHPQHRFRSTGTHQHSPLVSHGLLRRANRITQGRATGPALATAAIRNPHIHQFLREGLEAPIQPVAETDPLGVTERGQLQGRQHTIPAEPMGCREDMAGLLSAKGCTTGAHRSVHVLITHGSAIQQTSALLPRPLETEVGHHRRHETLIRERLLLLKH